LQKLKLNKSLIGGLQNPKFKKGEDNLTAIFNLVVKLSKTVKFCY